MVMRDIEDGDSKVAPRASSPSSGTTRSVLSDLRWLEPIVAASNLDLDSDHLMFAEPSFAAA